MSRIKTLGPLEKEVMSCLWDEKLDTVKKIHDCIGDERKIAYTTVMTIMNRLVKKNYLRREKKGKAYLYIPIMTRRQSIKGVVSEMISKLQDSFGAEAVASFTDELDGVSSKTKGDSE